MKDNKSLLTKKDLWNTLTEFFEKVIAPHFDRIDKKLGEHDRKFDRVDARFDNVDNRLDKILGHHAERIAKLETPLPSSS